jgi:hypothetical protein
VKAEVILDIIFCAIVLPGMMFLFPTGEWLAWQSNVVLLFVLWLYGVWVMGRKVLGPMLFQGGKGSKFTVVGALFLMIVVTFLMSFTPVDFPSDPSTRIGQLPLHVRAMWIMFIAVNAYAIPVGYYSANLRALTAVKEEEEAEANASEALEIKRQEAENVAGEEIQVKADYRVMHLPLSAIQYIEGRNNYACFHLDHRKDVVSQIALKSVMDLLPEGKFVRIHRSYIVPLWRIEHRTSAGVQLMGVEEKLPIGRAYKDNLKNA